MRFQLPHSVRRWSHTESRLGPGYKTASTRLGGHFCEPESRRFDEAFVDEALAALLEGHPCESRSNPE